MAPEGAVVVRAGRVRNDPLVIGAALVAAEPARRVIGALTEPMIPSFMQHLLDAGFQQRSMPLWQIPVVVIGLFLLASNYFRSERIQQTFELIDRNTPEEE